MEGMLADKNLIAVTVRNLVTDTAVADSLAQPTGTGSVALSGYLRNDPLTFAYCWNANGNVSNL